MPFLQPCSKGSETSYTALKDHESTIPDIECRSSPNPGHESVYRRAFYTLLVLYVPLFIITLWISHQFPQSSSKGLRLSPGSMNDLPVSMPIFEPDQQFAVGHPEALDWGPWANLLPPGRGFIHLSPTEHAEYLNAGNGNSSTDDGHYCVSMFHQLHCLAGMQSAFAALSASSSNHLSTKNTTSPSPDQDHHALHMAHCFDYLRQAIMCAGDMTLERTEIEADGTRSVTGWGNQHICPRDFEAVKSWTGERRYKESGGVL